MHSGVRAVIFSQEDPGSTNGIVCKRCARGGLLIVAEKRPIKRIEKLVHSELVAKALRTLATYAAAAAAKGLHERAEGIECAIETLKRAS
jgi:hypothetical protein